MIGETIFFIIVEAQLLQNDGWKSLHVAFHLALVHKKYMFME
jgi:hypothetical protein